MLLALTAGLGPNRTLKRLGVSRDFGDEGLQEFVTALEKRPTLTSLSIKMSVIADRLRLNLLALQLPA